MASRTALVLLFNVLFFTMISSSYATTCSLENPLQLDVCANVLGVVNVLFGSARSTPCCTLINGLVDLDATACLCTAIKADVLGINLDVPLALKAVLNACGRTIPSYTCPLL